jgi:hypothetical protein
LALRLFGIRALLCDHCNHQFKAFSLRAPKSRAPRYSHRQAHVSNPAPVVNMDYLNSEVVEAGQLTPMTQSDQPRRFTIDMEALRLHSAAQEEVNGAIVVDQISPVRRDLRTEITKLYAQGAKNPARQIGPAPNHSSSDLPACASCGSLNVKRRHRKLMERVAFSATDHKAFICRSCGQSFYARTDDGASREPGAIGAPEALR